MPSPSSGSLRQEFTKLRPFEDSELVIGLIAPVGTDLEDVRKTLREQLEMAGYEVFPIRITEDVIPSVANVAKYPPDDFEARVTALMDAGDAARKESGDNGILALGATKVIGGYRNWCTEDEAKDHRRRAYIVSSLKHPQEVETLRMIYPAGFYMIAVHEDPDKRLERLKKEGVPEEQARALMDRDKDGHAKHGQRVAATFHLADFFVRLDGRQGSKNRLCSSLCRIIDLMFGHPYLTPTFDEYAMFMAFAASLRSADLSRQVGAVVTINDQILSTGANDCPRFGGGLYWPEINKETGLVEDVPNGRDFMRGNDSNAVARIEIMNSVIAEAKKLTEDADKLRSFAAAIEKGRIRDLTEYGRVVHAEMEALLSCARASVSTKGGTLYATTYPCHNCAKHIIAAGITRVVFIEPYPKSKALEFHDEALREGFQEEGTEASKVQFEPFVGVGPRRFFDLFSISLGSGSPVTRKHDEFGTKVNFELNTARLRLQMLPNSYLEVEKEATDAFETCARQVRKGFPDEPATGKSSDSQPDSSTHS